MSYVEKNLNANETILYRTGLHGIVLVVPSLFGVFLILVGIATITAGDDAWLPGLFLNGLGGLVIFFAIVVRNSTEMAVTNKRVIIKAGLFRRKTIELFLSKIESIGVEQGLLGRMLGYGTIVVRGTGGTAEPFKKVHSPLEFRRQVQQHSENIHNEISNVRTAANTFGNARTLPR